MIPLVTKSCPKYMKQLLCNGNYSGESLGICIYDVCNLEGHSNCFNLLSNVNNVIKDLGNDFAINKLLNNTT